MEQNKGMKEYLNNLKKIIDENIKKELEENKSDNKNLNEMLEYATLLGGKRIRPAIMYMLADVYKKDYACIEKEAVAIELLHAYSLVHDDLPCMDNDEYRRGFLTVHKKYGQANAVLVGDALLTLSFLILAKSDYSTKGSLLALSYYSGHKGMILGQYLDILHENSSIDISTLLEIHVNKTAMLLMASAEIAAISLKIPDEARMRLRKFMFNLGLAYQIQDDILEHEGKFENTGKLNTDDENNKSTFVRLLGLEKSKQARQIYTDEAIAIVKDNELLVNFANFLLNREK